MAASNWHAKIQTKKRVFLRITRLANIHHLCQIVIRPQSWNFFLILECWWGGAGSMRASNGWWLSRNGPLIPQLSSLNLTSTTLSVRTTVGTFYWIIPLFFFTNLPKISPPELEVGSHSVCNGLSFCFSLLLLDLVFLTCKNISHWNPNACLEWCQGSRIATRQGASKSACKKAQDLRLPCTGWKSLSDRFQIRWLTLAQKQLKRTVVPTHTVTTKLDEAGSVCGWPSSETKSHLAWPFDFVCIL